MNSQKVINLLTICRKAGKMVTGFDVSLKALKEGSSRCILIASNTSPKTVKELKFQISKSNILNVDLLLMPITIEDVDNSINVYAGIIAICDDGFSKAFKKLIPQYDIH